VSEIFDLENADRVALGALGEPGQRVFLLQARRAGLLVTMKIEKQQVAALVEYLARVLPDAPDTGELLELNDLEPYVEPDFIVGTLAVSYDDDVEQIVLVAEELVGEDEVATSARITISRRQIAAFAIQGRLLVSAGRTPCPLCGYPLDPRGHVCPKTNGHRPPIT
jgi:uncharacterized repeat protein (TIGR03847 family)